MKKLFILLGILILTIPSSDCMPADEETARGILAQPGAAAEFRQNLNEYFLEIEKEGNPSQIMDPQRSVAKGVVFSALVPGTGQAYTGSYLKAALFFAVEVAALAGHFHFQNKGQDFEDDFERFADAGWNEDAYWDWLSQISPYDRDNRAGLQKYERDNFSHFLPEEKGQQYYENIGKYNQFVIGWNDFRSETVGEDTFTEAQYRSTFYNGVRLEDISPDRTQYFVIRTNSNDNFTRATNLATVVFLNHVISALDAGLSIKRKNRRGQAALGMGSMLYRGEVVPAVTLGVTW